MRYQDMSEKQKQTERDRVKTQYQKHRDRKLKYAKQYRDSHKKSKDTLIIDAEYHRNWRRELRERLFEVYGDVCACCGEYAKEFLTLEHKQGKAYRKDVGHRAYLKAIKEYRPDLYEILCYNCNCAKGKYGYCPHQFDTP